MINLILMLCFNCLITEIKYFRSYKRNMYENSCRDNMMAKNKQRLGICFLIIYLCRMTIEHLKSMRDRVLVLGRFL